jgi:quercetin dioxygenase-like cupin family protein
MERGTLRLTLDGVAHVLRAGDSIYYAGDCRHAFANDGPDTCVYYLAMELGRHRVPERPRRRSRGGRRSTR